MSKSASAGIIDEELISNSDKSVDVNDSGDNDKFSFVISKILNQTTENKIPVLARRKTSIMRKIEADRDSARTLKKLRLSKKVDRDRQMLIPDITNTNYERQLKKVATRGGNQ